MWTVWYTFRIEMCFGTEIKLKRAFFSVQILILSNVKVIKKEQYILRAVYRYVIEL